MRIAKIGEETASDGQQDNVDSEVITHSQIWSAIDQLALHVGSSTSGLAKKAGLDPTSLNKSKRYTSKGRERWPSTESIAKILRATRTSVSEFLLLGLAQKPASKTAKQLETVKSIPLLEMRTFSQMSVDELSGNLNASAQYRIGGLSDKAFAIELSHEVAGTNHTVEEIAIIEPDHAIGPNDRVIIKTKTGEIHKSILIEQFEQSTVFANGTTREELYELLATEIEWIARIAFLA